MNIEPSYGDMLNILLSLLFPSPQPRPRSANVEKVICFYNPNIPRIAPKLFKFLKSLGADPRFLETLRKELEKSLEMDRQLGCIPVYRRVHK